MTNSLTSLNKMDKKKVPTLAEIENKVDEFFEKADTNRDNKITLKEFKTYVKTDEEILKILFNHDIAKKEDLGTNHGTGEIPDYDSDLDSEINPRELERSEKLLRAKEGLEYPVTEDSEGCLYQVVDVQGD